MGAGAEVRLLRDCRPLHDLYFSERVSIGTFAQAGTMLHGQVPWNLDPCRTMNKRHSRKVCPKNFKYKNPPGIEKLGGPPAKDQPAKSPANQENLSPPRPGVFVRGFLSFRVQETSSIILFAV